MAVKIYACIECELPKGLEATVKRAVPSMDNGVQKMMMPATELYQKYPCLTAFLIRGGYKEFDMVMVVTPEEKKEATEDEAKALYERNCPVSPEWEALSQETQAIWRREVDAWKTT